LIWARYRWQVVGLFAALGAVLVAILATDLATGGNAGSPPLLGTVYPTSAAFAGPRLTRTPRPPTLTPHPLTPTITPTPQPGAGERDLQRRLNLESIRTALEEYRKKEGSYPNTSGNIQTLCAYKDLDEGCKLTKVLDPLPSTDPLGDPLTNGYWYASDGKSFVVYALQETEPGPDVPRCEKPDALKDLQRVYCVRSTQ
jgi:type II secretory pathway pseudopilin PulG